MDIKRVQRVVKTIYDSSAQKKNLHYHNWAHTAQVVEGIDNIVRTPYDCGNRRYKADVSGHEFCLLKTAGIIHDIGNIIQREGHEEIGVKFAEATLPYFGYDDQSIKDISALIMATKMPQEPANNLQEIMCDADLSILGYRHFLKRVDGLRREFGISDKQQWYEMQLDFLNNHIWFSHSAINLYEPQKKRNIRLLEKRL